MGKKLYRVREGKKLTGVCGGVAEFFDLDPTIVRVIWAVISWFAGIGILLYIICSLVVPEKPDDIIDV